MQAPPPSASKAAGPIVFAAGLWARFRESNVSSSRCTDISRRSRRSRSHISRTELPDLHEIIQAYENSLRPRPVSGYFRVTFLLRGGPNGKPRQGFAVVPGHPLRRVLPQLLRVPLQLGQIVERIDTIEFAGVNQAHEQVSHLRPFRVL